MLPEPFNRRYEQSELSEIGLLTRRLPAVAGDPTLTVALTGVDDRGPYRSTQHWVDGVLETWSVDTAGVADVVISSDGRVQVRNWVGGPLGDDGAVEKDLEGWTVPDVPSTVLSVRFGSLERSFLLRWSQPFLTVEAATDESAAIAITMGHVDAIDWLWGDLILGHLLWRNRLPLQGDIFALSAVEGIVSAPTLSPPPSERIEPLRNLALLFDGGGFEQVAAAAGGAVSIG